jgi:hypothetical protein
LAVSIGKADEEVGIRNRLQENPGRSAGFCDDVESEVQILVVWISERRCIDHLVGDASFKQQTLYAVIGRRLIIARVAFLRAMGQKQARQTRRAAPIRELVKEAPALGLGLMLRCVYDLAVVQADAEGPFRPAIFEFAAAQPLN